MIFTEDQILKITSDISQQCLEPILFKTSTIKKSKRSGENAEADIPVESECQGSVLSITTLPVILHSLEQSTTPGIYETTNIRALYIQQLLVTHFLCIDDITGSLE